ncbi:hypothetical protein ACMZ53_15910, partial [Klebsiella pneumoniae]
MSQVQSGILPEHCRAAIWIEANLKGDVNALREASKIFVDNVATFQAKFVVVKFFWTRRSDGRVMHRRATGRQGWPAFRTVR